MLKRKTIKTITSKKIKLVTLVVFLANSILFAQGNHLKIEINPFFKTKVLEKNSWYVSNNNDSLQFSKIKFYLTDFKILTKEGKIKQLPNSDFLVSIFNGESRSILLENISYKTGDQLLFNIGVNEKMNTLGVLSGSLDPANGMYWSWQSGYINFKIEGKSPSCSTRKNKFQFHIGGYKKPFAATRFKSVTIATAINNVLIIDFDIATLFDSIDISNLNQVMIPGKEAVEIADILPNLFSLNE